MDSQKDVTKCSLILFIIVPSIASVIDPNYSDKGEKKFETGKSTSKQIDGLLRQGKNTLQITRSGEGKETSYTVATPN